MYQLSDLPNTTDEKITFFEQIMQDKNLPLSKRLRILASFAEASEQSRSTKYWGLKCDITDALYFWSEKARI